MYRNSKYGRILLAADKGGSSGGGSTATVQSSGTSNPQGGGENVDDPWSNIDLDNLDDASRAAVNALRGEFATLQTSLQQKDTQVRQFQSAHDKTTAELNRIKQGLQTVATGHDPSVSADPMAAYVSEVEQIMLQNNVAPAAAKAQAPVMAQMLKAQEEAIMKRVGAGVAPVANMVMNHQAEQAFNYARATDASGAMAIPEVAQAVWNSVQEIAAGGTPVTPQTVTNLKGMHFMAHAEKNPGIFATLQMNRVPGLPSNPAPVGGRPNAVTVTTGGFNYPGATFAPLAGLAPDPNAAKSVLDPGTKAALQNIFTVMKPGHKVS
jgi:hypothetical protein